MELVRSPPALVVLFVALRRQKQEALMVLEEEDVRENIITYDDEGGGEEDTEAFDISACRTLDGAAPPAPGPPARDVLLLGAGTAPAPGLPARRRGAAAGARLREADEDPSVPPLRLRASVRATRAAAPAAPQLPGLRQRDRRRPSG